MYFVAVSQFVQQMAPKCKCLFILRRIYLITPTEKELAKSTQLEEERVRKVRNSSNVFPHCLGITRKIGVSVGCSVLDTKQTHRKMRSTHHSTASLPPALLLSGRIFLPRISALSPRQVKSPGYMTNLWVHSYTESTFRPTPTLTRTLREFFARFCVEETQTAAAAAALLELIVQDKSR